MKLLDHPLPGAGQPNAYCKDSETRPEDQTDNARSLGTLFTFGKTRILDLGDLTWDKEMKLMCPVNRLGKVDILVVSHHGLFQSSSPALVDAIAPRIAIMNNGAKKGGSTPTFETLAKAPGLETLWQLHFSDEAGTHNTAAEYIANPTGPDAANYLKLTVQSQRQFHGIQLRAPGRPRTMLLAELAGRLAGNFFQPAQQEDVGRDPDRQVNAGHAKGPAEGVPGGYQVAGHNGRHNS